MSSSDFFDAAELAARIGSTAKSVLNRADRAGVDLPPSVHIGRKRLWPRVAYEQWVAQKLEKAGITQPAAADTVARSGLGIPESIIQAAPRRGRPRTAASVKL